MDIELDKFYCICSLSEEFEIIHLNDLINKCVLIWNEEEYFLSVCNNLNEHD